MPAFLIPIFAAFGTAAAAAAPAIASVAAIGGSVAGVVGGISAIISTITSAVQRGEISREEGDRRIAEAMQSMRSNQRSRRMDVGRRL